MWRLDRAIMVLAGAGIIGILMIIFGPILATPWSTIITNIGMGFLVAGIVGITVELYVREQMKRQMDRMLHDVGADVFKAALGHEFPESVWEQISTHLLLNPVIRKNVNVDYNLEDLPGESGEFVKVQTCFSYTVCNLNTVQEWNYPCVASLDRCLEPRFHDNINFSKVEIDGRVLEEKEFEKDYHDAELVCRSRIILQPGQSREIRIHGESVYRSDQVIPFSMTDATENLSVNISKPATIEVVVDPLHPREQRLKEIPTASPDTRKGWALAGGLLPGHGVCIRWFPRQ